MNVSHVIQSTERRLNTMQPKSRHAKLRQLGNPWKTVQTRSGDRPIRSGHKLSLASALVQTLVEERILHDQRYSPNLRMVPTSFLHLPSTQELNRKSGIRVLAAAKSRQDLGLQLQRRHSESDEAELPPKLAMCDSNRVLSRHRAHQPPLSRTQAAADPQVPLNRSENEMNYSGIFPAQECCYLRCI